MQAVCTRPLLGHIRMGLEAGILPYQKVKSKHSLVVLTTLYGNIFLCPMLNEWSFVLLKPACQWLWGPSPVWSISDSKVEGWDPSTAAREEGAQTNCPALDAWAFMLATGDQCLVLKWFCSVSFLCNKSVSSSAWLHCMFLGDSDTRMPWAETFGLLFLVGSVEMIFAFLHVVGFLLWIWQLVCSVLFP